MKKRGLRIKLSLILTLIIIFCSLITVFAVTYIENDNWKFEVPTAEDDVYYVAGYTGSMNKVQIPALCLSKPVVKINNDTFLNRSDLTYIGIPATIETIGMNAFYGCTSLKNITIPANVSEIGPNAFYGCTSLSGVVFGDDSELTVLNQNTFSGCSSLTTVSLPEKLTSIGKNAFFGCTKLSGVSIGPYVTEIDPAAFSKCNKLTIFGWNDTYAQQYAQDNNITFISMGDYVYPSETTPTTPTETEPVTAPSETEPESTKFPAGEIYLIGDADLSGAISVKDGTLIQKYVAELVNLDRTQMFLANCDGVGGITVKDATQVQKYCADFKNVRFVGTEVEM